MAHFAYQHTCTQRHNNTKQQNISFKQDVHNRLSGTFRRMQRHGVHSPAALKAAGLQYTGEGDTARCHTCQLEVSDWTADMVPFSVHAERNPQCSFILSHNEKPSLRSSDLRNPAKCQKTEPLADQHKQNYRLVEVRKFQQIRRQTFSHWARETVPAVEQIVAAGFFSCNVADRVICLYCNLILQQWEAGTDDPVEVHKTLSPKCPYVLSVLTHIQSAVPVVLDGAPTNTQAHHSDDTTSQSACHPSYSDKAKRIDSFATWSHAYSPPVEALARAGFFYQGKSAILTCFHCNGSLHNWGPSDDPLALHIRWFSNCSYAQQLQTDDVQRAARDEERPNSHQLEINSTTQLSRLVSARLDLPSSQRLLDEKFRASVIKRCWEDQLQLKHADFADCSDLYIACTILQRQIDVIQGNKDNIVIPKVQMKLIRENKHSVLLQSANVDQPERVPVEVLTATPAIEPEVTEQAPQAAETDTASNNQSLVNACVVCHREEKRLACIPCGHFVTCQPCGKTIRTCPVCGKEINAFVRVFV